MIERWLTYQRERFPLIPYIVLAAVFAWSALTYSSLLRGAQAAVEPLIWLAAGASALLVFAQMRALDEIKDFTDDSRYRPYRAVPRGLVTLGEMRAITAAAAVLQLAIALAIDARLVWLVVGVWAYLALMTAEFFAREWLKARPLAYLATHVPLAGAIAFYLTAFDWLTADTAPAPALALFCVASIMATAMLEIGRKIRAPRDEELGVVTYSAAWGRGTSVAAWLAAFALMLLSGGLAAGAAGFAGLYVLTQIPVAAAALTLALRFLRVRSSDRAQHLETASGTAVLVLYLCLGPAYMLMAA